MSKKQITVGGVLKHNKGWGFKLTFDDDEEAIRVKNDIIQFLRIKGFDVKKINTWFDLNRRNR